MGNLLKPRRLGVTTDFLKTVLISSNVGEKCPGQLFLISGRDFYFSEQVLNFLFEKTASGAEP